MLWKQTKPEGQVEIREQDLSEVELCVLRRGDIEKGELAVLTVGNAKTFGEKVFPVTPETLEAWQGKVARWLPGMIIPLFFYCFIAKLIQLFLFSLASLIINSVGGARLAYHNLLNIGIFALVPPTFLALLVKLAGEAIPNFYLLYVLVYLVFLFLGIKHCRPDAARAEEGKA